MKKSFIVAVFLCGVSSGMFARVLIDKVSARVNGTNIMHSRLTRPSLLTGDIPTLDELITQELWVQKSKERGLTPSEEDIDRQILIMKQSNGMMNMTDQEVDEKLQKEMKMDLALYRDEIKSAQASVFAKNRELAQRCHVSSDEVMNYHESNPEEVPARYKLNIALLSDAQVARWESLDKDDPGIVWDQLDWLDQPDLAAHLQVVTTLKKGGCSAPIKTKRGFLAVQVVDKVSAKNKSFEERYSDIESRLREEKIESAAEKMKNALYKNAVIVKM